LVLLGRGAELVPVRLRFSLHLIDTQVEQVRRLRQAQPAFRKPPERIRLGRGIEPLPQRRGLIRSFLLALKLG